MSGLARVLIRPTSRRPRRCWRRWAPSAAHGYCVGLTTPPYWRLLRRANYPAILAGKNCPAHAGGFTPQDPGGALRRVECGVSTPKKPPLGGGTPAPHGSPRAL